MSARSRSKSPIALLALVGGLTSISFMAAPPSPAKRVSVVTTKKSRTKVRPAPTTTVVAATPPAQGQTTLVLSTPPGTTPPGATLPPATAVSTTTTSAPVPSAPVTTALPSTTAAAPNTAQPVGLTTTTAAPGATPTTLPALIDNPSVAQAKIVDFQSNNGVKMNLTAPADPSLHAEVMVEAIGFEEGRVRYQGPSGVTALGLSRPLNIDTKYVFHVRWADAKNQAGPEDTKTVEPTFPQPKYRGTVPVAGEGWSVLFTSDFRPTRRNPCAPINVYYDQTNQQLDLTDTIKASMVQAADASGVTFDLIGVGRTPPTNQPRVLVISWVTGTTNYIGLTTQGEQSDSRGVVWRTSMSLKLAASRKLADGRWGTVVLHELGHVLGLQHSHDPASLMFSPAESHDNWPWVTSVYTDGDKRGLKAVNMGSAFGCSPTIDPADLWDGKQRL